MRSSEFFYSHYYELMVLFVMIISIIPFFIKHLFRTISLFTIITEWLYSGQHFDCFCAKHLMYMVQCVKENILICKLHFVNHFQVHSGEKPY